MSTNYALARSSPVVVVIVDLFCSVYIHSFIHLPPTFAADQQDQVLVCVLVVVVVGANDMKRRSGWKIKKGKRGLLAKNN